MSFQITMLFRYPVLISIYPVIKTATVSPGCRVPADRVTRGKERTASRSSVRCPVTFEFERKFRYEGIHEIICRRFRGGKRRSGIAKRERERYGQLHLRRDVHEPGQ